MQIELEKSKSRLLLHVEAKKSQDERDIMAKKYDETIRSMQETHQNRMKALAQQHEIATEALMGQFNQEISMLKSFHKSHLDRILADTQEQISANIKEIENLKKKQNEKIGKHEN